MTIKTINGNDVEVSGNLSIQNIKFQDGSQSTTAGKAILTGADAAAQRTSLGLGTLATQNGTFSSVAILPDFMLKFAQPSNAVDILSRNESMANNIAPNSGAVLFTFFTVQSDITVTQITVSSGNTASSGLTLARMGLFTTDETGVTLVARTASDTSLFASQNTAYTRSFNTTGGYPSSYTLLANVRYGLGLIQVGTTISTYLGKFAGVGQAGLSPRIGGQSSGQADLGNLASYTTLGNLVFGRFS